MQFKKLALLVPAFLLGVQASVIPVALPAAGALVPRDAAPAVAPVAELVPRCPSGTCPPGSGTPINTVVDIDAVLKTYSKVQLTYLTSVINVFTSLKATADVDVNAVIKVVLFLGTKVISWSHDDLVSLCAALDVFIDAYAHGTVNAIADTYVAVLVNAGIDITTFTAVHATCLKTLITTCIFADVDLAVDIKTSIFIFLSNCLFVSGIVISDILVKVNVFLAALVSAVVGTTTTVGTTITSAVALKLALKAYIQQCLSSTSVLDVVLKLKLTLLLQVVTAWCSNTFSLLSATASLLLGIDLKSSSDLLICKTVLAFLLKLSAKFNAVADLHLDLSVLSNVVVH